MLDVINDQFNSAVEKINDLEDMEQNLSKMKHRRKNNSKEEKHITDLWNQSSSLKYI